jgi:hypothetical protein
VAPPIAAREIIPLRTNARIGIGMPGTCCVDQSESRLQKRSTDPAADISREPLGTAKKYFVATVGVPTIQRVSPDRSECATLFRILRPKAPPA